jgi:hypothetical protein
VRLQAAQHLPLPAVPPPPKCTLPKCTLLLKVCEIESAVVTCKLLSKKQKVELSLPRLLFSAAVVPQTAIPGHCSAASVSSL